MIRIINRINRINGINRMKIKDINIKKISINNNNNSNNKIILGSIDSGMNDKKEKESPRINLNINNSKIIIKNLIKISMSIGIIVATSFIGLHNYIEYFELRPAANDNNQEDEMNEYGWNLEYIGYSAGFLGQGTHPSLGWRNRCLIRSAWVADKWQSGLNFIHLNPDLLLDYNNLHLLNFYDLQENHENLNVKPNHQRLVDSAYLISIINLSQVLFNLNDNLKNLNFSTENEKINIFFELKFYLSHFFEKINLLAKAFEIHSEVSNSFINLIENRQSSEDEVDLNIVRTIKSIEKLVNLNLKINKNGNKDEIENKITWILNKLLEINNKEKSFEKKLKLIKLKLNQIKENGKENKISPIKLRLIISTLFNLSSHLLQFDSIQNALELQRFIHDYINTNFDFNSPTHKATSADQKLHELWINSRFILSKIFIFQNQNQNKLFNYNHDNDFNKEVIQSNLSNLNQFLDIHFMNNSLFQKKHSFFSRPRLFLPFHTVFLDIQAINSIPLDSS